MASRLWISELKKEIKKESPHLDDDDIAVIICAKEITEEFIREKNRSKIETILKSKRSKYKKKRKNRTEKNIVLDEIFFDIEKWYGEKIYWRAMESLHRVF